MNVTTQFDPEVPATWLVLDGACDYPSMRGSVLAVAADPALAPRQAIVFDLRAARWRPTVTETLELADLIAQPSRLLRHRLVFLITDAALLPFVQRIVALVTVRGGAARCCVEVAAARAWLRDTMPSSADNPAPGGPPWAPGRASCTTSGTSRTSSARS